MMVICEAKKYKRPFSKCATVAMWSLELTLMVLREDTSLKLSQWLLSTALSSSSI